MRFQFFPLRFEFIARESLYFPPGKAANILRGAFGITFQRTACRPGCHDARTCEARASCPYARIFAPVALAPGPSGLADSPRPFVFRARHLDGRTIVPGESFHFDLNLFSLDHGVLANFVLTFATLAREGLGPRRGKAELRQVCRRAWESLPEQLLHPDASPGAAASIEPASLDLAPAATAPRRIRVEFLSPTELKHRGTLACRPDFPILFDRIRDRISTLRALYGPGMPGPGTLDIDFRGLGALAEGIQMTRCEVRVQAVGRRSTRTGQSHSLGGFVGFAEYEGEMREFLPYLEAAHWIGVGRQAVWGKGEISIHHLSPSQ